MSSNLTESVKNYLTTQGFPFEMKVASLLQKAEFGIHQSPYYIDPTTEIPRELDIVAIWIGEFESKKINIVFPIECKYAANPWILFSSITKGFPTCYLSNNNGSRWIKHLTAQMNWDTFFEIDENSGYGLTVMNAKSEDKIDKQKIKNNPGKGEVKDNAQATKNNAYAAIQTLLNFLKSEHKEHRFAHPNDFVVYVPILVLKGPLVEAKLDEKYEIECREIDEGQIYYKEDLFDVIPKIHVVTETKLERYIMKLKADCEKLLTEPYIANSVIKSASSQPTFGPNAPSKNSY